MMKSIVRLPVLLIFAMIVSFIPFLPYGNKVAFAATVYYVSPTGTDSSARDGSSSQPWKTLAYAATRVPADAGNTIHLTAGTFIESSPTILPTGINVEGEGIGTTIIKSAYFYTGDPGQYAENYFLIQAGSGSQVDGNQTFSGFTLDGDARKTHGGIVVRHRNNVSVHEVAIQNFDWNGFWIHETSNNFQIYNCTFTNNSWGSTGYVSGALQIGDVTNSSIHDITINEDEGYGIKALGYANRYFENVDFYNLSISVPAYGAWNGGQAPDFAMELHDSTLKNVEIYDSTFNNNVSLVGNSVGTNPTVRFHHNTVDAHNGYAIEVNYDYMEVDHNFIYGGPYPFAAWAQHMTNQTYRHNTIYDISPSDVFRYANGIDNLKIYNNTFHLNKPGTVNIVQMYGGTSANLDIKNNIFWGAGSTGSVIVDPNHYISSYTVSTNLFNNYTGAALGSGNLTAPPNVTAAGNRPSPYYVPLTGSAVINAGAKVGYSYTGTAPDIGAFEYGASTDTLYEAESPANTLANGAYVDPCPSCSGGGQVKNIGNNSGTLQFNNVNASSAGTKSMKVYYINGDAVTRTGLVSVNGGGTTSVSFPTTGSWTAVGTVTVNVALNAGNNTIKFSNTTGAYAPDFDKIETSGGASSGLPIPWLDQDIGSVGVAGSAGFSGGTYTLNGAGTDIWGTADSFHYAYQTMSGDGSIVARVASVQNTNSNAKAGIMIRETLTAGSAHALMNITPGGESQFIRRTSTNGTSAYTLGGAVSAPYWVKLVRSGSMFSAYVSSNGTNWTLVGSDTIPMVSNVFVGLAVLSKNNAALNASTFSNVTVVP